MTIKKREVENGKRIVFLEFDQPLITDCLKEAVKIMEKAKYSEQVDWYKFTLNGVDFNLKGTETFAEIYEYFLSMV